MSANVETMFSVRETPWHGLGRIVMDAPASREALELAGLDWQVESRNIYSGTGAMIPGYRANVRSTDDAVLGVVSDRYRIVQNEEAFHPVMHRKTTDVFLAKTNDTLIVVTISVYVAAKR